MKWYLFKGNDRKASFYVGGILRNLIKNKLIVGGPYNSWDDASKIKGKNDEISIIKVDEFGEIFNK